MVRAEREGPVFPFDFDQALRVVASAIVTLSLAHGIHTLHTTHYHSVVCSVFCVVFCVTGEVARAIACALSASGSLGASPMVDLRMYHSKPTLLGRMNLNLSSAST